MGGTADCVTARAGGATAYNKYVSGSAHFVRSDLHGLALLWRGSGSQRMLGQVA